MKFYFKEKKKRVKIERGDKFYLLFWFFPIRIDSIVNERWNPPRQTTQNKSTKIETNCNPHETFTKKTETYKGLNARVILHEYDHIEGKLFIDRVSPFRKKLLKKKLDDIAAGRVKAGYKMLLAK